MVGQEWKGPIWCIRQAIIYQPRNDVEEFGDVRSENMASYFVCSIGLALGRDGS